MQFQCLRKKSQFYLFAAVLFISAVFLIVANSSGISYKRSHELEALKENYLYEARVVMNNAIYNNQNISPYLRNFTSSFIDYAATKDLSLGIAIFYSRENRIYIVNYLKEPILIEEEYSLRSQEQTSIAYKGSLVIEYLNESYYFRFSGPHDTEIKTLFVKEDA